MTYLPYISVVVPTYGEKGVDLTAQCLKSLHETHAILGEDLEVIIVDDGGSPEPHKLASEGLYKEIITQERGGFAKACNAGLRAASGAMTFLINNDTEFIEPSLIILSDVCLQIRAGVIGCRLIYPNDTVQHGGVTFVPTPDGPLPGYFDHLFRGQPKLTPMAMQMRQSLVTGAVFGIPRYSLESAGLLDERYAMSAEDIDYCLEVAQIGHAPLYCGYTAVIHHEGATRGATPGEKAALAPDVAERERESLEFLFEKWAGVDWMGFCQEP